VLINPDAPADRPETAQMVVIHRALRREFGMLPGLFAAPGDKTLLTRHVRLLLGMLHEHHEAEDELLWPALHARAPLADDLITTMGRQHAAVAEAVGRVEREMDEASLKELHDVLVEHLDLEESTVLPLIHEHLTVDEWHAPQEHAMKHGPAGLTDKLLLAGLVLEDATPREQAWFLSEMPPPARLLWRLIGKRRYARRVRAIRGA
jgi:hypothetical protein